MPIQRTYSASDLEKRLKILTMQLHGKQEQVSGSKYYVSRDKTEKEVTDLVYLKQDLKKIVFLAMIAIGAQFILFFSQLSSRINFFERG